MIQSQRKEPLTQARSHPPPAARGDPSPGRSGRCRTASCERRQRVAACLRVGVDYHVEIDAHYYSVPYRFARAEVEARVTARGVEIFQKGQRIAVHIRASGNWKTHHYFRTHALQPPALRRLDHRANSGRTPAGSAGRRRRSASRSSRTGPIPSRATAPASASSASPRSFAAACLEAAAERAIEIGARTYGSVKSILDNKLHPKLNPRRPRRRPRSSIPTSAGRATTIRRTKLAQAPHPRSASRAWPPGNGQGLRRYHHRGSGEGPAAC